MINYAITKVKKTQTPVFRLSVKILAWLFIICIPPIAFVIAVHETEALKRKAAFITFAVWLMLWAVIVSLTCKFYYQ